MCQLVRVGINYLSAAGRPSHDDGPNIEPEIDSGLWVKWNAAYLVSNLTPAVKTATGSCHWPSTRLRRDRRRA